MPILDEHTFDFFSRSPEQTRRIGARLGQGLEAGDVGTIVHIYRDDLAYEVEFTTLDGKTAAVVTVEAAQVRPVGKREITHARELAAS